MGSHDHDFYEFMYVYSGSITHDFSGKQQVLHASDLERTSPRGYQVLTKKQMNIFGDVDHIIAYIEQNYADVSLSSLAKRFGYSENYISKAIKEKTGLSFKFFQLLI